MVLQYAVPMFLCFLSWNRSYSAVALSVAQARLEKTATAAPTTRQAFLQSVTTTTAAAIVGSATVAPQAANADITSKLASTAALRNVKSVQRKLTTALDLYVAQNDYASIKQTLRVEPFSDIRKSCTTLIRGVEDVPDTATELEQRYKLFIGSLERLDSMASVALRGRTVGEQELRSTYQASVDALANFLVLAQESAEITVQYAE